MDFLAIVKIIGICAVISAIGTLSAAFRSHERRFPWRETNPIRRTLPHLLTTWAVGTVVFSGLVIFVIKYLGF